jgi:hypothetical protein
LWGGGVLPTTVRVNEKTLQMLNEAKKEMGAKSHDEVIKKLLIEREKNSLFHAWFKPQASPFIEDDRSDFPADCKRGNNLLTSIYGSL